MDRAKALAALDMLSEIGSHMIITVEKANEIGEPFGIVFKGVNFRHDPRNPKGPLSDVDNGVSTFAIADRIASTLKTSGESYFGRGSQFRADVEACYKVVRML